LVNKIIGKFEDKEAKIGLLMYFIPSSQNTEDIKTEMFFNKMLWKYFMEGKIALGYDPKLKCIVTIPEVAEIMRKDGIVE